MISASMSHFLGLDIGTTALKSVLYDSDTGQVIRIASRPTPVYHPQNGWSEHDPEALWDTFKACIREAAAGQAVAGLAISSMAETGVLVDAEGKVLSPAIAWYDRRSELQAARIEQQIPLEELYQITGQRVSPSFGLTKILWLRENLPRIFQRGATWLPIPSFLLWRLTGLKAVDYTIASRTLAFDQRTLTWSESILNGFDLPNSLFPPVFPGGTPIGKISLQAAQETGLPQNVICSLGGHDHLCASLAAGGQSTGAVTDSTGTASALLMLMPTFIPDPALAKRSFASYAYILKDLFVLKGGLKAAGSAIEWLARELAPTTGDPPYSTLEMEAWQGVGRRAGPLWLPHLIGSGTPEGDRFSRAALVGVQLEHNRGDLFRGMLESIGFWTRHNLEEMQGLNAPFGVLSYADRRRYPAAFAFAAKSGYHEPRCKGTAAA